MLYMYMCPTKLSIYTAVTYIHTYQYVTVDMSLVTKWVMSTITTSSVHIHQTIKIYNYTYYLSYSNYLVLLPLQVFQSGVVEEATEVRG